MPPTPPQSDSSRVEAENRRKFTGAFYQPDTVMRMAPPRGHDFFPQLNRIKLDLVARYNTGGPVLDLCCATADHLRTPEARSELTCGLDFSMPFLRRAAEQASDGEEPIRLVCGEAQKLPFRDAHFQLIYSFSSLYYIARIERVLAEVRRILCPGGVAILDLGNRWSLNNLVSRAHGETAQSFLLSVGAMRRSIGASRLRIAEHRAFQILPLWGERPRWLRPLLHRRWNRWMARPIAGRMLDEWICRVPGVRALAFRHIFVCRREGE